MDTENNKKQELVIQELQNNNTVLAERLEVIELKLEKILDKIAIIDGNLSESKFSHISQDF